MQQYRKEVFWLVALLAVMSLASFGAGQMNIRRQQQDALLQCAANLHAMSTLFDDGDFSSYRVPADLESTIRSHLGVIPHCPLHPDRGYAYRISSDRHSVIFCCFAHEGVQLDNPALYSGRLSGSGCLSGVHTVPPAKMVDARGLQFGPYGRLDLDITSFATVSPSGACLR